MNDKERSRIAIESLRLIALSYRERINREDIAPYEFAQQILEQIGEDLSRIRGDV